MRAVTAAELAQVREATMHAWRMGIPFTILSRRPT